MWLDRLIMDIKEQEMIYYDAKWTLEIFELKNTTYSNKYLNSNAYKDSVESYFYVKEKYEHMQRTLYLIQVFHPDSDLINPRYYKSEEEIEWENERNIKKNS